MQTIKHTLKKVIGRSCLSFEELNTLALEVEGIVNARPLTYLYDDDLDGINLTLTPSHLINGRRLQNTPNSSHCKIVSTHESLTRRSQHEERITWSAYVRLTQRVQGKRKQGIAVGDVVLLQRDSTKRVLWKLAIVKELLPGSDNRIRAAVVQVTGSRSLLKSMKHLIPIEVKSNADGLTVPGGPSQCE